MGNFGSKEDILVEIAVLFKQMDNGKLTLDELDDLVDMSRELHERTVILRYKAFEEKIFGVRPVAIEEPEVIEEPVIAEESIEFIEELEPEIEAFEEEMIEEELEIEEPLFQVEVKEEPSFGFSLFDEPLPVVEEKVIEHHFTPEPVEETEIEPINGYAHEDENDEDIEENNSYFNSEITESSSKTNTEQATEERPMSDIERAHSENLARFFNKSQETPSAEQNIEPEPIAPQFTHEEPVYTPSNEFLEIPTEEDEDFHNEMIEEEIEDSFIAEEPEEAISYQREEEIVESTLEIETDDAFDLAVKSAFIHKYNQVGSNLASQFGVSKIESLIGSFGLNERLQFINELFDGSSESFSNAIKGLDQQQNSEHARSKVAEFAIENNWDVDSETVEEFMQKIVRRYA